MSSSSERNISLVLKRSRIPENAGRILCPTLNTMVARKPTVNAWRDAPQIPWEPSTELAQIPSAAATMAQTYAKRTNTGKLGCTPFTFAGCCGALQEAECTNRDDDPAQ